jgi:phospholipid transport system substrate-binding protein
MRGHCFKDRIASAAGAIALFVIAFLGFSSDPVLAQDSDPARFVVELSREVSEQVGPARIDPAERKRRFAALVDEKLDLDAAGELLFGSRWSSASAANRAAFVQEFRAYLIDEFGWRVLGVQDGVLTVVGVHPVGKGVVVSTTATDRGQRQVSVDWRLAKTQGGWRLCDVTIRNISMADIFRSQFASVLRDSESDLTPAIRLLAKRTR